MTLDGRTARTTRRILGGERLSLDAVLETEVEARPENIPLDVLFEDESVIVLNKPAGMVVHPAPGNRAGTTQNALLHFDPGLASVPRSGLVHRLDKDTSGVMVVARNLEAHAFLVDQMQQRLVSRTYLAMALGEIIAGGRLDAPIGRHPKDRKRMAVVTSGKPAATQFRVLRRYPQLTYLEVTLETGRTHQIRVHLANHGHGLLGDPVYGRRWPRSSRSSPIDPALEQTLRAFRRQALHAWRLKFTHPRSREECAFEAPIPEDLTALLAELDSYTDLPAP